MNEETADNSHAELYLCLASLHSISAVMETCLAGLEGKRVTLEEKMIKTYINELLSGIVDYVGRAHIIINRHTFDIDTTSQKDLALLVADMQPVFEDLQKKIEYDWNFLEQYYEHEFYGRLSNELRFKERLNELALCVVEKNSVSKD